MSYLVKEIFYTLHGMSLQMHSRRSSDEARGEMVLFDET